MAQSVKHITIYNDRWISDRYNPNPVCYLYVNECTLLNENLIAGFSVIIAAAIRQAEVPQNVTQDVRHRDQFIKKKKRKICTLFFFVAMFAF